VRWAGLRPDQTAPRRLRAALGPALAAALLVSAAYQVALPVTLRLGPGLVASRAARDMHAPEDGYRWTRETSAVSLPGPGPFRRVNVEVIVSAWRPRGQPLPEVELAAEGARARAATAPRPRTVALETATRRWWSGGVELTLASPTVQPSRTDARRLGVRLHEVRLSTPSRWSPGLPPVRAVALAALMAAALAGAARRAGASGAAVRAGGFMVAALLGLAHVFARACAVVLLPLFTVVAVVLLASSPWLRPAAAAVLALARDAARRVGRAAADLAPWPALAIAAAACAATWAAYAAAPVLDLDLGSGREEPYAQGLLAYDAEGAASIRHASNGAGLDLRDLGGGTTWRIEVVGAADAGTTVHAGERAQATLGPGWSTAALSTAVPWGWRPGVRLGFLAEDGALKLDRVRVVRGRSLPSPRVALALGAAGVLLAAGFAAAGLSRRAATAAGLVLVAAGAVALWRDPLLATPLAARLCAIVAAAAVLGALAAAGNARSGVALPAGAVAACVAGFAAWLAAPLTPLYRGGHFVFHSSIAEEIWQGRLLHYALPWPGSMLSQQAQWGNVVVPHPCLFHLVVAPLAALPRPLFYTAVKAALALWLAAMAAAAALVARRLGGPRAATYAAVAVVATPATFQLVGLGHLMTIFGCWAMTMALAFVALRFERLGERRTFWTAAALLTVSHLSYTAALLFTMVAFALALPLLWRRRPAAARALVRAMAVSCAAAFFIYYVYWAWPFVSESIPRLVHGGAGGTPAASGERALAPRLLLQPHKLTYTFGTPLVPLAGLLGLGAAVASGGAAALLMLAWALVLVLFSGLDVFFNFLLKHHYFAIVPIAVGVGTLLARLPDSRPGRWTAAAVLAALTALSAAVALAVATGRIP
jgi:hypothetical protein